MKRILLIVVLVFVMLVAIAEIYFRVEFGNQLRGQYYPNIYRADSVLGYTYIPNVTSRMTIPGMTKTVHINSQGFPGPEFSTKRRPGTYRVIIIGTSVAGGIWMDGHISYAMTLDRLFKIADYPIEVINCSTDGGGSGKRLLDFATTRIYKYHPDLILYEIAAFPVTNTTVNREIYRHYMIEYPFNSKADRKQVMKRVDDLYSHWFLGTLYDHSYIIKAVTKYYTDRYKFHSSDTILSFIKKRIQDAGDDYVYTLRKSVQLLNSVRDTAAKHQCKLLFYTYHADDNMKKVFADSIKTPLVNLALKFDSTMVVKVDEHPNERGHTLIADSLFSKLTHKPFNSYIPTGNGHSINK